MKIITLFLALAISTSATFARQNALTLPENRKDPVQVIVNSAYQFGGLLDNRTVEELSMANSSLFFKINNTDNNKSLIADQKLIVLLPWYKTIWAHVLYSVVVIGIVIFTVQYIRNKIRTLKLVEEQRYKMELQKQEKEFQRQALVAEKRIIELENEKLHSNMTYRNKELANQTMAIINKNKFLKKVDEELNNIQDFIINDQAKSKICNLKRKIKKEIDIKKQNKIFETYFDEVHDDFFDKLIKAYPELTTSDLRVCGFIRMNLTTHEIATILNISYKGAEIRRYRLRKKLNLSRDVNLSSFLFGF